MKEITKQIQSIAEKTGGTWGIVLEVLETNERWAWNEDYIFNAASIIKIPIMTAAFSQCEQGAYRFTDSLTLKRDDIVGGSGVLQHMSPGTKFTIYDLIVLMMIQSDNTATNILIEFLGKAEIQQTMEELGLSKSKFFNKLMTVPVKKEGNNVITAKEVAFLLKQLATGKIISQYACERMVDIMKRQQIQDALPRKLPILNSNVIGKLPQWALAHKTGKVTGVRHDVGILYVRNKTCIVTILSKNINDYDSAVAFQDIGLQIFNALRVND